MLNFSIEFYNEAVVVLVLLLALVYLFFVRDVLASILACGERDDDTEQPVSATSQSSRSRTTTSTTRSTTTAGISVVQHEVVDRNDGRQTVSPMSQSSPSSTATTPGVGQHEVVDNGRQPVSATSQSNPSSAATTTTTTTTTSTTIAGVGQHEVELRKRSSTNLEDIPYDVWMDCIIQLLSLKDIIRLGAVSKRLSLTFDSESLFKKLCMERFNISPKLPDEADYYHIFKMMSASQFLAAVDFDMLISVSGLFDNERHCDNFWMDAFESSTLVHYFLTLNAKARRGCNYQCDGVFTCKVTDVVRVPQAKELFPELDERTIQMEYDGPMAIEEVYEIGSLIDLSVKKHGSAEAYQWMHIQLQNDRLPQILSLLWCYFRGRRLSSISSTVQRHHANGTLMVSLSYAADCLRPELRRDVGAVYHPPNMGMWYRTAENVCFVHSVLLLYVKNELQFCLNDYFNACRRLESRWNPTDNPRPGFSSRPAMYRVYGRDYFDECRPLEFDLDSTDDSFPDLRRRRALDRLYGGDYLDEYGRLEYDLNPTDDPLPDFRSRLALDRVYGGLGAWLQRQSHQVTPWDETSLLKAMVSYAKEAGVVVDACKLHPLQ